MIILKTVLNEYANLSKIVKFGVEMDQERYFMPGKPHWYVYGMTNYGEKIVFIYQETKFQCLDTLDKIMELIKKKKSFQLGNCIYDINGIV